MPTDRRGLLVKAANLAIASAMPVRPLQARAAPKMLLGAQTHFAQGWDFAILDKAKAAQLPLTFVRDELFWHVVESSKGTLNPAVYDPQIAAIRARGCKLLFTAFNINPMYDGGRFPTSEEAQRAFSAYVAACVHRFGNDLIGVEVWNELQGSFAYGIPGDDSMAQAYVRLLAKVYAAVKALMPNLPVSTGGPPGVCTAWYRRLVELGALNHCDAVAIHVYDAAPAVWSEMRELRRMVGSKAIWLTEFGYGRPSSARAVDNYHRILAYAADVEVSLASAYLLCDYPEHGFPDMGLLQRDGTISAQGTAYKAMAGKLPLTRLPTSTLAPAWRCSDGTVLAWTELNHLVRIGGTTRQLATATFLSAAPTDTRLPVSHRAHDWYSKWKNYGLDGGGRKVTSPLGGYPFGLAQKTPGYLSFDGATIHPTMAIAAVTSFALPRAGTFNVLVQISRPSALGDGNPVQLLFNGRVIWSHTVPPGDIRTFVKRTVTGKEGAVLRLVIRSGSSESYDATAVDIAVEAA